MTRTVSVVTLVLGLLVVASAAQAQAAPEAAPASVETAKEVVAPTSPIALVGASIAAALAVIGGAMGIARIATGTVAAISRQPEAAGQMFLAWLLPAAMIEGVTLFGIVLCLLVITR